MIQGVFNADVDIVFSHFVRYVGDVQGVMILGALNVDVETAINLGVKFVEGAEAV